MHGELLVEQKYLKKAGLIALITVLNMTAPLSTDMYLPSFTTMLAEFGVSERLLNMTLSGFFLFFAVGMLLFGPFSDRYGRKPVLVTGISLYLAASVACGAATNIYQLILFRVIQALGAGCMVSVSTALVKDSFDGRLRGTVLATIQSMSLIAPMLAPVIGSFIVRYATWRTTFHVLAGISLCSLTAALLLEETVAPEARQQGPVLNSLGRLFVVGRNWSFTSLLLVVALIPAGFMAYIAVSSYIYVEFFGLSETAYSLFFATNAAVSGLGPLTYIAVNKKVSPRTIITFALSLALCGGLAVLFFGKRAPWAFLLSFLPYSYSSSLLRPVSTDTLLSQQDTDTGSASALINFGNTLMGSLGMTLVTLRGHDFVMNLGTIAAVCALMALVGWTGLLLSAIPLRGIKEEMAAGD